MSPEKLIWYAVDFDDTLARNSGHPDFTPTEPILENLTKLDQVHEAGYKVIIHTARPWADYELVEKWLEEYNVEYKSIVMGKLLVHRYVDDKAINADEESWI